MLQKMILSLIMPLIGTALGASFVFFMKSRISDRAQCALEGFAGGVMIAASVWSLIIPAIDASENFGKFSFVPAATGLWAGVLFLFLLDKVLPQSASVNGDVSRFKSERTKLMMMAVVIHNLPEGLAVGAVVAGALADNGGVTMAGATLFSFGIAVQNIPEGAIISLPSASVGKSRSKAFLYGVLSGVIEPIGAALTVAAAFMIVPFLPYLLAFAAGAMICVVVEDLVPAFVGDDKGFIGVAFFFVGFTVMMVLDVALG